MSAEGVPRGGSRRSIRSWLMLLGVGTAALSLFAASSGFVIMESVTAHRSALREASLLAEVVGTQVRVALAFDDALVARENLASLRTDPAVRLACLYDAEGVEFARYPQQDMDHGFPCPSPGPDRSSFQGDRVRLFRTLSAGDERVGSLFLERRSEPLVSRIVEQARIGLPVLVASALLAFLFATRVQKRIAEPIQALVESSRALARGELGPAPPTEGAHELAVLSEAFGETASGLRELIGQTRESAGAVAQAVESLRESSRRVAIDARAQRAAVADSTKSLERIGSSIQEVSSSAGELSQLAEETTTAHRLMDDAIGQVAGHASDLATAVESTDRAVGELSASIEAIAASVAALQNPADATVASIEDLRTSVDAVRGSAERSDRLAARAAEEARRGQSAVRDTIDGMHEIRESFAEIERVVADLSQKSGAINEIVRVIDAVADDSSLLSLNAAIIAAQAGEQGRGFHVVAQEVRGLAARTTRSAKEIADLVRGVQECTESTVNLVSRGSERVTMGVQRSEDAGRVLGALGQSAEESAETASEIAKATEQQADDIQRVDSAAVQVRKMTERIARATAEQRGASAGIERTAERLRQLALELERLTAEQRNESQRVENVAARIEPIAEAAQSQFAHRERIEEALVVFRRGAELGAEHAEALERIVAELAARSEELEQAVSRFQL